MADKTYKFQTYVFHARAIAAYFHYNDSRADFGPEYSLAFHGAHPFRQHQKSGRHDGPHVSFTRSWVHISCRESGGMYSTIAKAGLKNYSVKGKVTASELEAGIMTVYRKEWYRDPARPRRARILPLPPVIKDLQICGKRYRVDKELHLPEPFHFSEARRKKYFQGDEPEIEPVGISAAPGRRESSDCGEIEISEDTRRVTIPGFGIVSLVDWMWQPAKTYTSEHAAQWIQLVDLNLENPGSGGSGVGGNGSAHGGGGR